jgi:hypothetical protein
LFKQHTTEETMPPRKRTTATLDTKGAKIGEPIAKAIVDTNTASLGIPPQPAYDPTEEINALRKQIDLLRKQVADATQAVKSGASQAARKTQATAALYPMSTLIATVAVIGAFAFALSARRATSPRSRYDLALAEMRDLFDRARDRF